jgi:Putative 2OG-Fe(II) oxygenase
METSIDLLEPFHLPIFLVENVIDDKQSEFLRGFCESQEYSSYDLNNSNSNNAVKISNNLKLLDEIPEFKTYLEFLTLNISRDVMKQECEKFSIVTSWATKTEQGDKSHFHCHKNYYMAGVLYLQDENKIQIANPLKSFDNFNFNFSEQTPFTCHTSMVTAPKNSFLLMPAYLNHAIGPWENNDLVRYSIAMNILPAGKYGMYTSMVY